MGSPHLADMVTAKRPRRSREVLDLNVGGTHFMTGASTLRKAPFFEALLRHREAGTLDAGTDGEELFVDRSPALFADVLEFLRTGAVFAPSPLSRARLGAEFKFFGLDPEVIQDAPGSQTEDAVICGRYLRQMSGSIAERRPNGEGCEGLVEIFAPSSTLRLIHEEDRLGNLGDEQGLWWRILPDPDGCVVYDQFSLAGEIERAAAALRRRGFNESGRSESSSMCSDGYPLGATTTFWLSETVRLSKRV